MDLSSLPIDVYALICDYLQGRDLRSLAATSIGLRNMMHSLKFDISRLRELRNIPEHHIPRSDKQLRALAIRICVKARKGIKTDILSFCQALNLRGYVRLSGVESRNGENFFILDVIAQGFGLQRLCTQLCVLACDNKLRDLQEIYHGPRYHNFRIHKSHQVDEQADLLVDRLSKGDYAERRYRLSDMRNFPLRMQDEVSNTSSNVAQLEEAVEELTRQIQEQARRQEEQARRQEEQARRQEELAQQNQNQLKVLTEMVAALLLSRPASPASSAPATPPKTPPT